MRVVFRPSLLPVLVAGLALGGCRGTETLMQPVSLEPVADVGSQTTTLSAGATAAEYAVVVANTALDGTTQAAFTLRGDGIGLSADLLAAGHSAVQLPAPDTGGAGPRPDVDLESRLRDRERLLLAPRIASAQEWFAARGATPGAHRQAVPAAAGVGDLVTVNVNGDSACSAGRYHAARVVAIGQRAIIVEDTLNPRGGFTAADYGRIAARFDTLIFPVDSAAFGAPSDIDGNGRVILVFTRAVNEATPHASSSYVGGITFSRDLFPIAGTAHTQACATSNEGEYFYLLAPDPRGTVNGNVRPTQFVDSILTAVVGHELQHLINGGRRLYVNSAPAFEEKWLDEALSHVAEELLFYRESGLHPRGNTSTATLQASARTLAAYNSDMSGNQGRYQSYLRQVPSASPFAHGDDLATRGGSWSLLRYLLDHAASPDGELLFGLVNSRTRGLDNLAATFGPGIATQVRDWNVSHVADDVVATPAFQQPSWNWHAIYEGVASGATYPLSTQSMQAGATYSGSVRSGGAAYSRLTVPANTSATLSLIEQSAAASTLSLVTVRTR